MFHFSYWFNFVKFWEASSKNRRVLCAAYVRTAVNVRIVMNNDLEKMWKDSPWPGLRYCPHINIGGTGEDDEKRELDYSVFMPWFEPGTSGLRSRNIIHSTATFHSGIQCWSPLLLRTEQMYAELFILIRVKRIGPVIREALVYWSKPGPSVTHGNTAAVL